LFTTYTNYCKTRWKRSAYWFPLKRKNFHLHIAIPTVSGTLLFRKFLNRFPFESSFRYGVFREENRLLLRLFLLVFTDFPLRRDGTRAQPLPFFRTCCGHARFDGSFSAELICNSVLVRTSKKSKKSTVSTDRRPPSTIDRICMWR